MGVPCFETYPIQCFDASITELISEQQGLEVTSMPRKYGFRFLCLEEVDQGMPGKDELVHDLPQCLRIGLIAGTRWFPRIFISDY